MLHANLRVYKETRDAIKIIAKERGMTIVGLMNLVVKSLKEGKI
jgi:hypothetical protein